MSRRDAELWRRQKQILELLRKPPQAEWSAQAIGKSTGASQQVARNYLERLVKMGLVSRRTSFGIIVDGGFSDGGHHQSKLVVYQITLDGVDRLFLESERLPAFEIFEGALRNDRWFWRLRASNGEVIADGAQSYFSKGNAFRAAKRVRYLMFKHYTDRPVVSLSEK